MFPFHRPSYLVPNGVVSGIKLVHPMFRGFSQQDTQEFLRCFMDQLHEELKQTMIEETDDKEEEPQEETASPIGQIISDRQVSMETSSSSSQSDDYETCDSALGSGEQNCSSDENGEISELSRLNVSPNASPRARRLHARKIRTSLSKIDDNADEGSDLQAIAKEEKDQLNMTMKATENIGMCSDQSNHSRNDSITEYADAMSETEPLQNRVPVGGKKIAVRDREAVTRRSISKYYKPTTSHSKLINIICRLLTRTVKIQGMLSAIKH